MVAASALQRPSGTRPAPPRRRSPATMARTINGRPLPMMSLRTLSSCTFICASAFCTCAPRASADVPVRPAGARYARNGQIASGAPNARAAGRGSSAGGSTDSPARRSCARSPAGSRVGSPDAPRTPRAPTPRTPGSSTRPSTPTATSVPARRQPAPRLKIRRERPELAYRFVEPLRVDRHVVRPLADVDSPHCPRARSPDSPPCACRPLPFPPPSPSGRAGADRGGSFTLAYGVAGDRATIVRTPITVRPDSYAGINAPLDYGLGPARPPCCHGATPPPTRVLFPPRPRPGPGVETRMAQTHGERSDQRRWFHTRSVWLGRRRSGCRAAARHRTGYGALASDKNALPQTQSYS